MDKKSYYFFKNIGLLTLSNFASKILVFLLVPVYTSVLSAEEYGMYDLVVTTVSLLYPILTLNIVDAVMRFSMDKDCRKEEVASIGVKYVFVSILIFSVVLGLLNRLDIIPRLKGLNTFILIYYCSSILNQFFIQYAKGNERVKEMGVAGVLGTIAMLSANLIFLLVFKTGLRGFFVANILAQVIPVCYFFVRLEFWNVLKNLTRNRQLERKMLIYCVPLVCTIIGWWVNSAADRYVVTWMCGIAANGILSVAYKIPSIINTLQGILIQAWQISAVKEYGNADSAYFYGKIFNYLNFVMCTACSFLVFLTKPLAHLLYANDFYIAWKYVPFLLVSSVFNFASGFMGPILSAKKESKSMAMASIYGAVANTILNILLVYFVGVQGATISTVVSSLIIYLYRKHAVGKEIIILEYSKIIFTWMLLLLQALIEIYMQYWYIEILLMVILMWCNYRIIIGISKKLKRRFIGIYKGEN